MKSARLSCAVPVLVLVGLNLGVGLPAHAGDDKSRSNRTNLAQRVKHRNKGPAPATGVVSGWVPNNGAVFVPGLPDEVFQDSLGDLWTFRCPLGGRVIAIVDTQDDLDRGTSCLDPVLQLFDSRGTLLASADDNIPCRHPTACGYSCPSMVTSCATRLDDRGHVRGTLHSFVVRDFGDATQTAETCSKGGGYQLEVAIYDAHGQRLPPERLHLGGGPVRRVPFWVRHAGFPSTGPALDDEAVPNHPLEKQ